MDRHANGRFAPGHADYTGGQGGRKRRAEQDAIKAALDAAMPAADVVAKLAEAVERCESWAIQLWLAYRWGKPIERVDLDATSNGQTLIGLLVDVRASLTSDDDNDLATA